MVKQFSTLAFATILIFMTGCKTTKSMAQEKTDTTNDFSEDVSFLTQKDDDLVTLKTKDQNGQILVSPKYQGKVFTSTAKGEAGTSFGWINYDAFKGEKDEHMNAYGGEDRLWLGSEGGPFSLFFKEGKDMEYDNWHTPAPYDTESWKLTSSSDKKAELSKDMELENYAGTDLKLNIQRDIEILEPKAIEDLLSISLTNTVSSVGFKTTNKLYNKNDFEWDKDTGAPVIWNLDMFTPSPETVIAVPYKTDATGKLATTDYFGEIPKDRIYNETIDGILFLKADGKSRDKFGVTPHRAKTVAGSYAPDKGVLTIILYDLDDSKPYLNQKWTTDEDPFEGDAVNAYNDGPLEDGSQMGPFYELESVSPAAFIKPDEHIIHTHSVFHFIGDEKDLEPIAEEVLGTSLDKIESVFE